MHAMLASNVFSDRGISYILVIYLKIDKVIMNISLSISMAPRSDDSLGSGDVTSILNYRRYSLKIIDC